MKTKMCPYCNKQVSYIEKMCPDPMNLVNIYRYYCEECRRMIDEKIRYNEKSENFEFSDKNN